MRRIRLNTRISRSQLAHHVRSSVRGIVIDIDDLPRNSLQRSGQFSVQRNHVVALVEGGLTTES